MKREAQRRARKHAAHAHALQHKKREAMARTTHADHAQAPYHEDGEEVEDNGGEEAGAEEPEHNLGLLLTLLRTRLGRVHGEKHLCRVLKDRGLGV